MSGTDAIHGLQARDPRRSDKHPRPSQEPGPGTEHSVGSPAPSAESAHPVLPPFWPPAPAVASAPPPCPSAAVTACPGALGRGSSKAVSSRRWETPSGHTIFTEKLHRFVLITFCTSPGHQSIRGRPQDVHDQGRQSFASLGSQPLPDSEPNCLPVSPSVPSPSMDSAATVAQSNGRLTPELLVPLLCLCGQLLGGRVVCGLHLAVQVVQVHVAIQRPAERSKGRVTPVGHTLCHQDGDADAWWAIGWAALPQTSRGDSRAVGKCSYCLGEPVGSRGTGVAPVVQGWLPVGQGPTWGHQYLV